MLLLFFLRFTSVLFKQNVGTAVLKSSFAAGDNTTNVAAHAFCSSTRVAAGSITLLVRSVELVMRY